MRKPAQPSDSERRRRQTLPAAGPARVTYGRPQRLGPGTVVAMVSMRPDTADAVLEVMQRHGLSRSGAIHHLVRLGAGLPPLPPFN